MTSRLRPPFHFPAMHAPATSPSLDFVTTISVLSDSTGKQRQGDVLAATTGLIPHCEL